MRANYLSSSCVDVSRRIRVENSTSFSSWEDNDINVITLTHGQIFSSERTPLFLDYISGLADEINPPFNLIFNFEKLDALTQQEVEDISAVGQVFVDLSGTVVFSGVNERIREQFCGQMVSDEVHYAHSLESALEMF